MAPEPESIAIAKSPESARPGELVALDDSGRHIGRARMYLRYFTSDLPVWIGVGLGTGLVSAAINVSFWWFLPLLFLALLPVEYVRHRTAAALFLAQSKLASGDIAGGEEALAAAPRPKRGRMAALRARLEGYVADAKGDVPQAIRHYERSLGLYPKRVNGEISRIVLMDALARDRQLARARALRSEITVASGASLIHLMLMQADLSLAIAEGSESALDDEALHEWVQIALTHNFTKNLLVMLARVLTARGDDDLADHCLAESEERFDWCPLENYWPSLHWRLGDQLPAPNR